MMLLDQHNHSLEDRKEKEAQLYRRKLRKIE
jgi:hypothetical protein